MKTKRMIFVLVVSLNPKIELEFHFFITSMVVPCGTAAPVLLKWFVSRDVPTGAPSSNGTIIPIPIPAFPLFVCLHSRKFIRSMDGAIVESGVLVRASPILLPERSSSQTRNALFRFVLHFLLLASNLGSYLESFCGVLRLLFFCTVSGMSNLGALHWGHSTKQQIGHSMRALVVTLPTSRQLMAVGHDQKAQPMIMPMKMNISHGGVCICMLGVLLSCDPATFHEDNEENPRLLISYADVPDLSICSGMRQWNRLVGRRREL